MVAVRSSGLSAVAECYGLFFNKHCSVSLRLLRGVSFTNGILTERGNITIHGMGDRQLSCKCKPAKLFYIP